MNACNFKIRFAFQSRFAEECEDHLQASWLEGAPDINGYSRLCNLLSPDKDERPSVSM
jgi:hypothetical protein